MNILIWNECAPEEQKPRVKKAYPNGMQDAIAEIFKDDSEKHNIRIGWQGQPQSGFSDEVLKDTDLVIYWAHCFHDKLPQEDADRLCKYVENGMGAIFLHSAHPSKPFTKICGATGALRWREDGRYERVFNVNPNHPIASGVGEHFYIPREEMYGEYFDIGTPDDVVFLGWFPGGELCRSGVTYTYGKGKVFYFQPGHETFPNYYIPEIKKIIHNAAYWATGRRFQQVAYSKTECSHTRSLVNTITLKVNKK